MPSVTVVIATRNREALLSHALAALLRQTFSHDALEIIVADNGSTDGTRALVEHLAAKTERPHISYLYVEPPGKSGAVNRALEEAHGDVIALTDDDVEPAPAWLEHLVEALTTSASAFATGRIRPKWEQPPPTWLSRRLYGVVAVSDNGELRQQIGLGHNTDIMPIGANMAVRADVVRSVGGLRTDLGKLAGTLRTGEDHEFFLRLIHAGCTGVYEPKALVEHFVPASRLRRSYFVRWLFQNGKDVAKVEAHYRGTAPRLLGVPRYLWRAAAQDCWSVAKGTARADRAFAFYSLTRVLWFAGYVSATWLGTRAALEKPGV